jgi:hypothetical protein
MRQKSVSTAGTPEKLVRDIRRATRKQYSGASQFDAGAKPERHPHPLVQNPGYTSLVGAFQKLDRFR